jgi:hypothetical protein
LDEDVGWDAPAGEATEDGEGYDQGVAEEGAAAAAGDVDVCLVKEEVKLEGGNGRFVLCSSASGEYSTRSHAGTITCRPEQCTVDMVMISRVHEQYEYCYLAVPINSVEIPPLRWLPCHTCRLVVAGYYTFHHSRRSYGE